MNQELDQYFRKLGETITFPFTYSVNRPIIFNRGIIRSIYSLPVDPLSDEPLIDTNCRVLPYLEVENREREELDLNWRYYMTTIEEDIHHANYVDSSFSRKHDKTIYCLGFFYLQEKTDLIFHTSSLTPFKIWIDGNIVYNSHAHFHINNFTFIISHDKGFHYILFEKVSLIENFIIHRGNFLFYLSFKPYKDYQLCEFIGKKELMHLEKNLAIIPENPYFRKNQVIRFRVLPQKNPGNNEILLNLFLLTHEQIVLEQKEVHGPGVYSFAVEPSYSGVFKIVAESQDKHLSGNVFIFYGDYPGFIKNLQESTNEPLNREIANLSTITDIKTGKFQNSIEHCYEHFHRVILKRFFEIQKPVLTAPDSFLKFHESPVDGENLVSWILLPRDYDPDSVYPLVVNFVFGMAQSRYPFMPYYERFNLVEKTITVSICGRGGLSKDFINETEILKIIDSVISSYPIDLNRIYGVGVCSGSMRVLGLARRIPHLFAAILIIEGTARLDIDKPDYSWFVNLNNTLVITLCNTNDFTFHFSRIVATASHFAKNKVYLMDDFLHFEFEQRINSLESIDLVLKEKRNPFPVDVEFLSSEPQFNRSYWIRIDRPVNVVNECYFHISIVSPENIMIELRNVEVFTLFLSPSQMHIDSKFIIQIDGEKIKCSIDQDCLVTLDHSSGEWRYTKSSVINAHQWERNLPDENRLGIRQLFLYPLLLVFPVYYRQCIGYEQLLYSRLTAPLVERARSYKYDVMFEEEVVQTRLAESSFLFLANLQKLTEKSVIILESLDILKKEDSWYTGDTRLKGSFYIIKKMTNPFNNEKQALLAVYSDDAAGKKLFELFRGFDSDPIFYTCLIIWQQDDIEQVNN